jgi:hypothetical protein
VEGAPGARRDSLFRGLSGSYGVKCTGWGPPRVQHNGLLLGRGGFLLWEDEDSIWNFVVFAIYFFLLENDRICVPNDKFGYVEK